MKSFLQFISESLDEAIGTVQRWDNQRISDFGRQSRRWNLGSESSSSVSSTSRLGTKGVFAGRSEKDIAAYSAGASQFAQIGDKSGGTIYYNKRDEKQVRKSHPTLSTFSAKPFRKLDTGEYFSKKPNKPISQRTVSNPIPHISKAGYKVRFVPDPDKIMQFRSRISERFKRYGTEEFKTFGEFIIESEDPYYYHGTIGKYVPDIIKKGLQPGVKVHQRNWDQSSNDRVYLASDPAAAKKWAVNAAMYKGAKTNSVRVLKVRKDALKANKLTTDTNFKVDHPTLYTYKGGIPKKAIEWHGQFREEISPIESDPVLRSRIRPAIRHKATGKVHIGDRGDTHWQIRQEAKLPLDLSRKMHRADSDSETYGYERGYYDPRKKTFHDDQNFDTVSLLSRSEQIRRFGPAWFKEGLDFQTQRLLNGTEETIYENLGDDERKSLMSRAIPALQHPVTGKIHVGKRGQDHIDLADSIFNKDKEGLKHYTELKHSGYIDPGNKNKFYSREDAGFDSTDLLTPIQRMRKYGTEEIIYEKNDFRSRIVPALKHYIDKNLIIGKRGQTHQDVYEKRYGGKLWQNSNYSSGFYDPKHKKFLSAYDAGVDSEDLADLDSTDLMTKVQRMRRYGTEGFKTFGEFLNESKWDKYVYHATYAMELHPYSGMHVGSLHAAMARAHQQKTEDPSTYSGRDLTVHAFKYNTKGKSSPIIDHTDESGSPTEMITHDPHDVSGYLHRHKVIAQQATYHEEIGKALKQKGITHLSYRNTYEDPGSTSHMIYDPENLQHVHSFKSPKFVDRYKKLSKPYFAQRRLKTEAMDTQFLGKPPEVLKNPTHNQIARQFVKATTNKQFKPELRWLTSGKDYYTADAYHVTHADMVDLTGVDKLHDTGFIRQKHLGQIKKHPKGPRGWMEGPIVESLTLEKFKIESDPQYASVRQKTQQGIKVWRGEHREGSRAADPGDFGSGPYYTTSRARAGTYAAKENVHRHFLQFKNPLVLDVHTAYKKLADPYKTVKGWPHNREARSAKLSADLRQQGYDAVVSVSPWKSRFPQFKEKSTELEIVDLRREEFKTFREFLNEMIAPEFRHNMILRNPSVSQIEQQITRSPHKEVRYVDYGSDYYTADSFLYGHGDISDHVGKSPKNYYKNSGMITTDHLSDIKGKGIKPWMRTRNYAGASRPMGENFPASVAPASEPENMEGNELLSPMTPSILDKYKRRRKKK